MNACPICSETLTSPPVLLSCGHINCSSCVSEGKRGSLLHCQWPTCSSTEPAAQVKYMPFTHPSGDPYTYESDDKAMDDELVDLAREHGHIPGSEKMDDTECEIKRQRLEEAEAGVEQPHEDDKILELLDELERVAEKCEHIRGFYEHEKGSKIVIDVTKGDTAKVAAFLATHKVRQEIIQYEEKTKKRLLVATGAKLADSQFFTETEKVVFFEKHPDKFHDAARTATVTCLAIGNDDKRYILTAKHMFGGPQQTGNGSFISCLRNKMADVSNSYRGVHATISNNESYKEAPAKYQVDIAALELIGHVNNNLAPHLMRRLKPHFGERFNDTRRDLKERVVYKQGAISGTTCGVIVDPFYRDRDIFGHLTRCIAIRSQDPRLPFATAGDSGALIWDDQGTPIAIVTAMDEAASGGAGFTYAVRLDHCLQALRQMHPPIDIKKCEAIGSPIVPVIPEPDPGSPGFLPEGAEAGLVTDID